MQTNELFFNSDLMKPIKVQYLDGNFFSQDVYGNVFTIDVFNNGVPATLAGTVSADIIRPDGSTIVSTDGNFSDNRVQITFPASVYSIPGTISIVVKISDSTSVTTVLAVVANVYQSSTDIIVDPGTIIPSIQSLISAIDAAVASIPADYSSLWTSLAPAFSTSTSYSVGQYVVYDGGLYRFKNAHSGSWSSADVDAVDLGTGITKNANDIYDLKSALYAYNSANKIPIRTTGQDTHGITFTPNMDWSYTVSGTADSSGVNYSLISGNGKFPYGIGANSTFKLSYNGYSKVKLQLYRYINGSLESGVWKETSGVWDNEEITLGSTVTGLLMRLRVLANTDITTPVTVMPAIMTARSNEDISSELEGIRTEYYGKVASSAPSAIKEQFDTLVDESEIDFSEFTLIPYTITAANKWTTGSSTLIRSYVIEIPEHTTSIKITTQLSVGANIAFLKTYSYPPTSGDTPDFADGTERISISAGTVVGYPVTENMKYLFVNAITSTGTDVLPDSVVVYFPKGGVGGGTVINYNTYDITVNPTITTDTNGWLQPVDTETTSETGKTDMTSAIMAMLNSTGYCHLAPGIFYVSGNIEMPANSRIEGCGKGTKIKLLEGEQANTIIMGSGCSIANVWIKGAVTEDESSLDGDITIMARCGIKYATGSVARGCVIESCRISGFSGAGILMQDTGTPVDRGVCISNCFITVCNVGIYIRKNCEFNKITNCTITKNYYGYLNRGGNNDLSNSGLDSNVVNAQIDDNEGTNGGHGTITGCSFNHADDNHGYGLIIEGTGRMLVSNCNFYYAKVKLENTNQNILSNCNFGSDSGIEVIGSTSVGGCSLFIGCMMRTSEDVPRTRTNNTDSLMINCYDRAGNALTFTS